VRSFARPIVTNPAHHPLASQVLVGAEQFYLSMVQRSPDQYAFAHNLTDAPGLDLFLEYSLAGTIRKSLAALVLTHKPDVVVSVYPLFTRILTNVLRRSTRPRLMTVVTDLGNVHRAWFNQYDDCVAVPSALVREKAIRCGVAPDRVVHTGLPINPAFGQPRLNKEGLRRQLGWDESLPTLLLLSGGAGIGPVFEMAQALDATPTPFQLAVVAGRNQALADMLRAHTWRHRVHIYDFVPLIDMMHATDVIASKAGGLTVSEALAAAKPMVFYGDAPGQEEGNRDYVSRQGAALVAETSQDFALYASRVLISESLRYTMAQSARRLGMPQAAQAVGREIATLLQRGPVRAKRTLLQPSSQP
jgi:1,2-diacylglycerol 3-beta-galactosyltransferase